MKTTYYNLVALSLFVGSSIVLLLSFPIVHFSLMIDWALLLIHGVSFIVLVHSARDWVRLDNITRWFFGLIIFGGIVLAITSFRVTLAGGGEQNGLFLLAVPYIVLVSIISGIDIALSKKN